MTQCCLACNRLTLCSAQRARAATSQRDGEEIRAARHAVPAVANSARVSLRSRLLLADGLIPDFASLYPGYFC